MSNNKISPNSLVKISLLGGLSFIFMYFEISLFIFPNFLKIDISNMFSLFGSFALFPGAGVLVEIINLFLTILLKGSSTMGIGEIFNCILGSLYSYTAGKIYFKNKTLKQSIFSLIVSTILSTIIASLLNYFIILPLYFKLLIPYETIISMSNAINSNIIDLKTLIIYAIMPFNIIKYSLNSIITFIFYKKVSNILHLY